MSSAAQPSTTGDDETPTTRRDISVEVDGRRVAVCMWIPEAAPPAGPSPRTRAKRSGMGTSGSGTGRVVVPMQGTIVKVLVAVGDAVDAGDTVCVLEAMKMENNVAADRAGTVSEVLVEPGDSVGAGDMVVAVSYTHLTLPTTPYV